jgi:hypothetical protein
MKGFLVLGTILVSLIVALFWAAPSKAFVRYVQATTRVEWQGTNCIAFFGASNAEPDVVGYPSFDCIPGTAGLPRWAEWEETRTTGQVIGIDPIMDNNNWMRCTLWVNAQVVVTDYARARDGREVSCLRTVV